MTDVITRSSGDTTIRVVIRTGGQDHVISNAVVEWLVPDSAHNGERRIIKSTDVSMLASGMYSAWGPTFDVDDMGLACIVNVTNTHIGPYAPEQRMRIRIGAPGDVKDELLDDMALDAMRSIVSYLAPERKNMERMNRYGDIVIDYVTDPEIIGESPFVIVRDSSRGGKELLSTAGYLEYECISTDADGSIELTIDRRECCAGTKTEYLRYRIESQSDTAQLLDRVLIMYELQKPLWLLKTAKDMKATSAARIYLDIARRLGSETELSDNELRAWTTGVSLVPDSKALVVATEHSPRDTSDTWALVIGYPVLTADVVKMLSGEPGMIAGWVRVADLAKE
ncbi:MAG: hypothetical protein EHM43_11775 [Ignavibacteriae bacterium]|nr:MAG: hypothetical protein EHM43_11775 [Ignavibacteriota bacterium]